MRVTLVCALFLAASGWSRAAAAPHPRRVRHAPPAETIEDQSFVRIGGETDWRVWLSSNYPDNSATWPAACAAAEKGASGSGPVMKGDFNRNGRPTTLAVRTKDLPGGRTIAADLSVKECRNGRWRELLRLTASGVWIDGKRRSGLAVPGASGYSIVLATGLRGSPSLRISANETDAQGEGIAEAMDFFYIPEDDRYEILAH